MAWIVKNETGGIFMVTDLNITFHPHQIRDMDLLGRETAEKSVHLRQLLNGQTLKEVRKDAVPSHAEAADRMEKAAEKMSFAAENARKIQEVQNQKIAELQANNEELTKKLDESTATTNRVLDEFRAFAEKFPVQIKNIAETMHNISSERQAIAQRREELAEVGTSDPEIKVADRILALKDKKLEKNLDNLGKTISGPSTDVKEALDALDQLGI